MAVYDWQRLASLPKGVNPSVNVRDLEGFIAPQDAATMALEYFYSPSLNQYAWANSGGWQTPVQALLDTPSQPAGFSAELYPTAIPMQTVEPQVQASPDVLGFPAELYPIQQPVAQEMAQPVAQTVSQPVDTGFFAELFQPNIAPVMNAVSPVNIPRQQMTQMNLLSMLPQAYNLTDIQQGKVPASAQDIANAIAVQYAMNTPQQNFSQGLLGGAGKFTQGE